MSFMQNGREGCNNMDIVSIDSQKCIGCGLCVKDCVTNALVIDNKCAKVISSGCISCGHCYAICPKGAVSVSGMPAEEAPLTSMQQIDSTVLLNAMKSRRSIRSFSGQHVEPEKLEMILEAGRYSPTGSNAQDVHFTVLGSRQDEIETMCVDVFRKGITAAGLVSDVGKNMQVDEHFFFKKAPLVIVVSGKSQVNASLASAWMELMAESLGLGVLYSGFFIACAKLSGRVKAALELPKGIKPVTCLVIGYTDVQYQRIPGRKPAQVKTL